MMLCSARVRTGLAQCEEPAVVRVTFRDGDQATVCQSCALALQELARSHGSVVGVETLVLTTVVIS